MNSLSVFTITLFLLMTYINNWFRSYRNKLHSDMNRFKFPDSSHSAGTYKTEELINLNEPQSPTSLKYNDMSMSQSSDSHSYKIACECPASKSPKKDEDVII